MSRLYAALIQANQAIMRAPSEKELFESVCHLLVKVGGLQMVWIGWLEEETRRIVPVATFGDDFAYLREITVYADDRPEGRGPTGIAYRTGRPHIANDLRADPATELWRPHLERSGFLACAAFPVSRGGRVLGALSVYAGERDFFLDHETSLLAQVADSMSFTLDNITREEDRRRAEQRPRSEEHFSDTMLESMPGIVYVYDTSGQFVRWNRNFETVSGHSAAAISGMHPLDFVAAEDRPRVQARIELVFSTGEAAVEAAVLRRNGSSSAYFFTGKRVIYQDRVCLLGVGIDISEQKRAEALLRHSQAHLVEAQRIAGMGSWELDVSTGRLAWSEQVYEVFGASSAEFEATYDLFISFVHPDDRAGLAAAKRAVLGGSGRLDVEHRIVLRDGTEKVVHELADVKRDEAGRPLALSGTVQDITGRVRLEAERQARYRAEAADRVKSSFLATMSHELRTPLNSIIGFTGILLQGLAGPLNEEQGKQLGMVRSSARHLLALVNDVLDISKIEAEQLEVACDCFDLRRAILKGVTQMTPQAHAKGLAVEVRLSPDLAEAVNDERRFAQILLNLLSNAVKFTEHGRIVVSADLVAGASRLRLRVSDTGIGIRPDDLPGLFEPFHQIDTGLARHHEGTGLGLAICRRLAGLMGGDIRAESAWGQGSTFTLSMPLKGLKAV